LSRNLRPSLVRVWDDQGFVVGAGFLVGPRHVLTCAHVVAMVLGVPDTGSDLPRGEVQLDFPLLEEPHERVRATTVLWLPVRPDGGGDIAGLLLDAEPPEGAEPALLTSVEEPWGLEFRTFGFPEGRSAGDWASGILADRQATGWLQIEHERQTGRRVQPGYSGAPVWVQSVQGVIGMVVAADQRPADRVAYVIPTHALVEGWPGVLGERAVPANPYRGLTAFRESDAAVFFGRSDVTDRLDSAVHARPFTALVGPSGSGKSSVVRAGLVARLLEAGGWTVVDFRPRKEPFDELAAALLPHLEQGLTKLDLLEKTPKLARLLREGQTERVLRQIADETGSRLLLIADQFEELYTHSPDPRSPQQLVHELLRTVGAFGDDPGDGLSVLVTMRADFLNQALGDRDFAQALAGAIEPIGPMSREQLQEVIEGPAKLRGTRFEPGLVDRIMADVGDQPGLLPLLEFTLTLLWDEQENRRITHAAYNAIGGVQGALTHHAEQEYERCNAAEREQIRRVLVQLVLPGDGTEDTRRLAAYGDLAEEDWPIVGRLADRRLVVTSSGASGEQTVEIAHEALIRGWARLREWVAADREFRLWQERVRNAIRLWHSYGEDQAALLRGSLLVEAQTWIRDRKADITDEEQAFVSLSQERQESEDAQYKRLYQEALSRHLVAQAELSRSHRANLVPLSVLLSIESLRRSPSFEADYALRRGMTLLPIRTVLLTHDKDVQAVAFSPDGTKVATGSDDATARIWDARTGNQLACLRHDSWIRVVAFAPGGDILATGGEDGKARLWAVRDGAELAVLPHGHWVGSLAFSPDGALLATGCDDGVARVWAGGSQPMASLEHAGWVRTVQFHPAGQTVLTGSGDGTARLWSVAERSEQCRLEHGAPVRSATFNSGGSQVATGDGDGVARLWTPDRGGEPVKLEHSGAVTALAFNPAGTLLAAAAEDGAARLWDVGTGAEVVRLRHDGPVRGVAFSADGSQLATASDDGTGRIWLVGGGVERVRMCHSRAVRAVVLSSDGTLAATASQDHQAAVWSTTARAERLRLTHGAPITNVAAPARAALAAGIGDDGTVRVWDQADGALRCEFAWGEAVRALAFSPGGELLAGAGDDGVIRVWDVAGAAKRRELAWGEAVRTLAFSPDGTLLAGGGDDGLARIWDVADLAPRHEFRHEAAVGMVAFSPDSARLATAGDDRTVCIWQVTDAAQQSKQPYEQEWVGAVALDPQIGRIATVGAEGQVRILDIATGAVLTEFSHETWVADAVFSRDGARIATAGEDGSARIWDTGTGAEMCRLAHGAPVTTAAFSHDDAMLVTGAQDGCVRVWPLRPDDLIGQACRRLARNLTVEEWRRYVGGEPYRETCAGPHS
jgi:WD40 repeat protein